MFDAMNKFSNFFNENMSEYQISKAYFTLIDNLSDEEIKELDEAVKPYWNKAIKRDLDFVAKTGYMMGL